jgi:fumarate hydratase subunit beta
MRHNIDLPISSQKFSDLKLGDIIYFNGIIITARDQAHKRIIELHQKGAMPSLFKKLNGSAIYHCGPIIKEDFHGFHIISGGPTTSQRMDSLENEIINILKVKFIIGKGGMRNLNTENNKVAYLSFTGGCGAIINKATKKITNVLWRDLGLCEAVWFLKVANFGPLIVSQINGKSLYK